ncbi:MAG: valine--tRNA ligase, partial [Nostocaceae cyanobacterium]|nr:valine--tRNA ligase [Nostocaceae cyanobacterium]
FLTCFILLNLVRSEDRKKLFAKLRPKPTIAENLPSTEPEPQPEPTPLVEPEKAIAGVVGTVQVLLPLAGVVDIEAFGAKLQKKLSKIEAEIQSLSTRLTNPKFVDKAPAEVVLAVRDTLAEAEKQAEILRERLLSLGLGIGN